ncbi:hypothetical protein RB595_006629 [Gaeumannomyces hyphopodioides]
MSGPSKPAPAGGGAAMSLYANLLDPKAADPASAPRPAGEKGAGGDAAVKKPMLDPATLRFQPMRRPQPAQKLKPKTSVVFHKAAPAATAASSSSSSTTATVPGAPPTAAPAPVAATAANAPAAAAEPPARSSLADWAATEEDEYMYGTGDKRQRGGRKAKKNKNRDGSGLETNWDDLYDPSRPTNIEEYLRSDERIAEIREWKAVLNAHRVRRQRRGRSSPVSSDADEETSRGNAAVQQSNQFAPPPSYSFAPPPPSPPRRNVSQEAEQSSARPSAPPPADGATGEDAYTHRTALSTGGVQAPRSVSPTLAAASAPSDHAAATISRAPVRYDAAAAPDDEMDVDQGDSYDGGDDGDEDGGQSTAGLGAGDQAQRSSRPGQSGFAARMMEKMGWEKGRGLGAEGNEGITRGLSVKLEKRRRLPDAEGGGFAQPAGVGRIVGGKPAPGGSGAGQEGKFGRMSEVVVLRGMLEGMHDVAAEVEKGLSQEIGEECGEKYGRLERVYIHVDTKEVFIKFTDQVSALRAVNALQGRVFNGNAIVPAFYDVERFEAGVYQ